MDHVNRTSVKLQLRDVRGELLTDHVKAKFYNQRVQSLSQIFEVDLTGHIRTLPKVPAFPYGLAEVLLLPSKYRFKSVFINVPSGKPGEINETFFIDPNRASATFPTFTGIKTETRWTDLWRILRDSGVDTAAKWKGLVDLQKAGLFNVFAKAQQVIAGNGKRVADFVARVTVFKPERIFAEVETNLLALARFNSATFHSVPGTLHEFPKGWKLVEPDGSFKTHDKAGNLQITFARNGDGGLMADIDIDDHQGIAHAADVLKHKITGKDTHPFDIHQILIFFQGVDPGYEVN